MRTTLALDDDLLAKAKALRWLHKALKANDYLPPSMSFGTMRPR
jgi:hypothetical protein